MLVALFTIVAIVGSFVVVRLGLPRVNVLTIFSAVWIPLILVGSYPRVLFPGFTHGTWTLLLLALAGIVLGTFLATIWRLSDPATPSDIEQHVSAVDVDRLIKIHVALCIVLFFYFLWQIYLIPQRLNINLNDILSIYFSSGNEGHQYRSLAFEARDLAHSSGYGIGGAAILQGLVSYILFFVGNISLFTGARLWLNKKRALAAVPLMLAAAFSIFSLQRSAFLLLATLFLFSVVATKWASPVAERVPADSTSEVCVGLSKNKSRQRRRRVAAVLIILLSVLVLFYPQYLRNRGTTNHVSPPELLLPYYLAGVGGLNYRDNNPDGGPVSFDGDSSVIVQATPGSYTFSDFFITLRRLDFPVHAAPLDFDYRTIEVSGVELHTNTGTMFFNFWLDFGLLGVFFITFGLALLTTFAQRLARQGRTVAIPALSLGMSAIFWSFSANYFLGNLRYILLIIAATVAIPRLLRMRDRSGFQTVRGLTPIG
ncbi:O-antigen ligase [Mycobacterium sp. CVI_P3]|uniref:O-antigen ligase n=1 Tax=Mycobacterium pinniadriaticum TaxID=2994102 RepID=A0ABT3SNB6_9MYCO|nr:O-antigen polymerase [Mycobacterium pinniadriaticum]MCX2934604.1 O-antigen ligase [Mycobacterium pinniadriaticum]MCX2941027.1 O-antigen ligase [Mycobacterium pinniadriaticum]